MRYAVIDLFCGVGGASLGWQQAGASIVGGADIDSTCKYSFMMSHPDATWFGCPVQELNAVDMQSAWGMADCKVLIGSPPCQAFSTSSRIHRGGGGHNIDVGLFMSNLAVECAVDVMVLENVPAYKRSRAFQNIVCELEKSNYWCIDWIADAQFHGVPQRRKRLFLIGIRNGPPAGIARMDPTPCGPSLHGLPVLACGERHSSFPLHWCCKMNVRDHMALRHTRIGDYWNVVPKWLWCKSHFDAYNNFRHEAYHQRCPEGRRLDPSLPSPTITTQCYRWRSGQHAHPWQDRMISLWEMARLQGFPDNFPFQISHPMSVLARQIGNAVPPPMAFAIAKSIVT